MNDARPASARFGVALAAVIALAPAAAGAAPPAGDAVDDLVRAEMDRQGIPGLALAILQGSAEPDLRGYGLANVELDAPVTPDTIFQSGSIGKQFTAAGILLLAEDGRLSLDDTLARHFPAGPPSWHRIRIRHLLTHTSGLKDYGDDEVDLRRDYSEAELLRIAMSVPLDFEPGTQWSYSNTGYLVLGLLVSRLAGRHWDEFLAERVFGPAGMTTTRMISEAEIVPHRASGYRHGPGGALLNQEWVSPTMNSLGDGALYFSVRDLAAWDATLEARRLLAPASYAAWWTPVTLADGTTFPYGFGWDLDDLAGRPVIRHGGSWQGFRTEIARFVDDGLTLVVLANCAGADPTEIVDRLAGQLDEDLREPSPDATPVEDPDPARTARLLELLAAFGGYHATPAMGRGLRATASGSVREAALRADVAEQVAGRSGFRFLGEQLLSQPLERRGETATRIAWYLLQRGPKRRFYRFHLTADGKVADFSSQER